MIQAVRSGKQNIVEGFADGVASAEMEIKLLNAGRASLKELKEDYLDYLAAHQLMLWEKGHPRYERLLSFCRQHNRVEEYAPCFEGWTAEEFASCANIFCHMVDKMLETVPTKMAAEFEKNGGLRERMAAVRLGRRQEQNAEIVTQKEENRRLQAEIEALRRQIAAFMGQRSSTTVQPPLPTEPGVFPVWE